MNCYYLVLATTLVPEARFETVNNEYTKLMMEVTIDENSGHRPLYLLKNSIMCNLGHYKSSSTLFLRDWKQTKLETKPPLGKHPHQHADQWASWDIIVFLFLFESEGSVHCGKIVASSHPYIFNFFGLSFIHLYVYMAFYINLPYALASRCLSKPGG